MHIVFLNTFKRTKNSSKASVCRPYVLYGTHCTYNRSRNSQKLLSSKHFKIDGVYSRQFCGCSIRKSSVTSRMVSFFINFIASRMPPWRTEVVTPCWLFTMQAYIRTIRLTLSLWVVHLITGCRWKCHQRGPVWLIIKIFIVKHREHCRWMIMWVWMVHLLLLFHLHQPILLEYLLPLFNELTKFLLLKKFQTILFNLK